MLNIEVVLVGKQSCPVFCLLYHFPVRCKIYILIRCTHATEHILRNLTSPTQFRNFSPFVEAACFLPCSLQFAIEPHKSNPHPQYLIKLISILSCHLGQHLQSSLLYMFFKLFHIFYTDHLSLSIL
jgi:hypothetical protein